MRFPWNHYHDSRERKTQRGNDPQQHTSHVPDLRTIAKKVKNLTLVAMQSVGDPLAGRQVQRRGSQHEEHASDNTEHRIHGFSPLC